MHGVPDIAARISLWNQENPAPGRIFVPGHPEAVSGTETIKLQVLFYSFFLAVPEGRLMPQKSFQLSEKDKQVLLDLARKTIEARTSGKSSPGPETSSPILNEKCGAFVTLHKKGELRGCIGYLEAYKPLSETIIEMAVSAALKDRRFSPVEFAEVKDLDIEISVLSPLEIIKNPQDVEVGKHGLVIERGYRCGLLLPQVATEQNWDRETFLSHTCMKAGLPADAWKDTETKMKVFTATVFGEKEMNP